MSELAHDTTHVTDATNRLISQYVSRPRLAALIAAIVTQYQILEDAIWGVYIETALASASGDELDLIGRIVGQPRNGSSDPQYIVFISARIKTNRSNGKMDELLAIAALLMPTSSLAGIELFPSAVEISADAVSIDGHLVWRDFLNEAKGAGKRLCFIYSTAPSATTLKRGTTVGSIGLTTSQQPGSNYSPGIGGGLTAGVFG